MQANKQNKKRFNTPSFMKYSWTFMLKIINTKRRSPHAGAKGYDHALTALTEYLFGTRKALKYARAALVLACRMRTLG